MRRTPLVVRIALFAVAAVYAFPFVWMCATALKPLEQTMTVPPVWIPRARHITVDGVPVRVTVDPRDAVAEDSALVRVEAGADAGRQMLVPRDQFAGGMVAYSRQEADIVRTVRVRAALVAPVPRGRLRAVEKLPDDEFAREPRVWYPMRQEVRESVSLELVNFRTVTRRMPFFRYFLNSLIVAVLGVVGVLVSNTLAAYGFSKVRWPGRDAVFFVALATMMVPFPVTMIPLFAVFRTLGMTGTLMPLWVPAFFGHGFNIFLLREYFRTIPNELVESARMDGCSEAAILWRIMLPLSRPILVVIGLFHFMSAWSDFMGPLVFLTDQRTFTLSLGLQFFQSQHGGTEWHLLMAASVMVIAPVVALFLAAQRALIENIKLSGLKG